LGSWMGHISLWLTSKFTIVIVAEVVPHVKLKI